MTSSRISRYHVQGSHYTCAHTLGVLTGEAIRHRINNDLANLSKLFAFAQTDCGLRLHEDFIKTIQLFYPWYWDEIRGLADGSGIPLMQIIVLNFLNETQTVQQLLEEKQTNETGERGCTTILLNRSDTSTFSLLHNEDHATSLYLTGYLVQADIQSSEYNDGQRSSPKEKYLAYCYAGTIPGEMISM